MRIPVQFLRRPLSDKLFLGSNILNGGAGDDIIWGSGGNAFALKAFTPQVTYGTNTFVFNLGANDGHDTIGDFNKDGGLLEFHGVADLADVNAHITCFVDDGSNHLRVNFTSGGSITFNNVAFNSLAPASIAAHDISNVVSNISQIHTSLL